jgi:hypothetical protein
MKSHALSKVQFGSLKIGIFNSECDRSTGEKLDKLSEYRIDQNEVFEAWGKWKGSGRGVKRMQVSLSEWVPFCRGGQQRIYNDGAANAMSSDSP